MGFSIIVSGGALLLEGGGHIVIEEIRNVSSPVLLIDGVVSQLSVYPQHVWHVRF